MKKNLPVTQQEMSFPDSANILTTTDLKGSITYANEDFVKISGFTREELIGNNHNMVRHPDMPPAAFAQLWTRVKSGHSWMGLVKNRCKNGDHYWVDAYVTPILQAGKIAEYQSIRRRADRKAVARAEKLYATLSAGKTPKELSGRLSFNVRLQCWLLLPFLALLAGLLWLESVALMAGVVVLALVAAMLGQWLTLSPLRHAVAKARRVINDPLGQYIYTGRKDEVGEILLAFKALEAETAGLVGRISDSAGSMMRGATSMSTAVGSSSDGIQRQFAETDQVAAAINEMSASVHEVAHNAQKTSHTAHAGLESVAEGKRIVNKTQSLIQSLRQEIAEGGKVIRQVKQSSSAIASVLDVIKAIAEQTNLLALNAAIEAARAGDSGRGFAVVADEVRSLASRTQASTEDIRQMIDALESGSTRAVAVMEAGERHAEDCVGQGQLTVAALDDIYQSIQGIRDMSTQIATAVEQQSQVAEEINRSISRIRQSSESNLGLVEESKVTSGGVLGVANRFEELAAQFWARQGV